MSIHMCMSIHMPPAISKALRSCREPPDWAYRKFQVYRGRPAPAADGAAKAVEHIAESIVRFKCTTNSMNHTVTQASATSMPIISIQLSCHVSCHVISSPFCGAAH